MISYSIYVVDDEQGLARGIVRACEQHYKASCFFTAESALEAIKAVPPDLVLLDIGLPGMNGIEALCRIKRDCPEMIVIMITAIEEVETVIRAMKLGAYDYVVKPIRMELLEKTIQNALEKIRLQKEVQSLRERYLKERVPIFIGESKAMQEVMKAVETVSQSQDTPVLILGESGTGKELIASAIHYRSPNFRGPLVVVNCASIPKDLIESELFGYERGAFSGAEKKGKKGLVEHASNGTLFLDEIGDLSLEAQAKLLRFLENGEFYRVGGTVKQQIQTRLISATNKDIYKMIEEKAFREDLYFRVGVFKIEVPSLNNRREDIIPIAKYFLVELSKKIGKKFTGMSPEAEKILQSYDWRGNVREIRNIMGRAILMAKGPQVELTDLGIQTSEPNDKYDLPRSQAAPLIPSSGVNLTALLEAVEKGYIQEALKISKGNEAVASKLLQLNYSTFRYRKNRLNIT